MSDEPAAGDRAGAGPTASPGGGAPEARPVGREPRSPKPSQKPRKPGSGQHRKKPAGQQVATAEAAAAKAQAAARRKAEAEAAAERARLAAARQQRKRRTTVITWASIGLVIALLGTLVIVKAVHKPAAVTGSGLSAADPAVVSRISAISPSVLDTVGDGGVPAPFLLPAGRPAALTQNGLPRILYIGALYCPFCATERWPMVAALSRFGSFSGLKFLISADTGETIKNIHTLDFSGVTYTSTSLVFTPVETQDRSHNTIASLTSADDALFTTYDASPTLPQGSAPTTIPFVDLGNRWVMSGASFNATELEGMSWQQIAAAAAAGTGAGTKIDGTANWLTAALCELTGNSPAPVCSDPMIHQLEARLPVQPVG